MTSLVNVAIEAPRIITVYVIRPISTSLVIVLKRSIFLSTFHELLFHQANMPQCQLVFSSDILVSFVEP